MKGFPGNFPTDNCDKNFKPWTELENGAWMIIKDGGANCSARCFEGVRASSKVVVGEWLEPGYVDCEFLEAVCWENGGEEVYGYIHTQIKPNSTTPPPSLFPNPPNVFVFTIDSMSFGSAKRSLPKFLNYFQSEFQAVEFPFVNKVGENSKPNGIPLWFGKSISGGRKVNWEEIVPDWNRTEFCDRYLDNETHIFKQFKQHGYTTLQMEDWVETMIDSFPSCQGFYERPADHIFRPFSAFRAKYGMNITRKHLNGKLCRQNHHAIMDLLQQAITAYSDRPLFSWIWLIDIGHDYSNGPYRMDQYLIDYFENNRQVFDDSFVFFVSDHGFRMGVMTEIGLFERSNPYLAISIPKKYRDEKNGMLEMMRVNSRQLQTHFDTRATMLDILMVPSLIEYGYSTLWNTYEIEVKTAEPSAVHFQTMVTYDPKTETMNFEKVVRLDKYGDTADCTASVRLEPLCHCKK
ncbi:hypothetical protein GCK72_015554 [Caenorhabditis remanei]|uniref:Sulfatase N-terminal domain-containing protein n=1 Tax=Caenorhabditis remanei TaxID=31234 RepID=A0A6A5GXD1_CAERE|nr:hypothetical protein GCK72_015554 [Caenorhabditis remanei]KAF1759093.1 hypothetical protein GCK72_015554 [Caenorhabditis remanei]